MNKFITILLILFTVSSSYSQKLICKHNYTHYDTLRGSITTERAWWDLLHYELYVSIDPDNKAINGSNIIRYKVLETYKTLQIDLQYPLVIDKVYQDGILLEFDRDSSAHFIYLHKDQIPGTVNEITVEYSGYPHEALRAPWDGGISWSRDDNGNHFIATSCQGIGASIWWPCKDHMYDEPDEGIIIHANVPKNLIAVANGRLEKVNRGKNKTKTYTWKVVNKINNYGVNINIGDYAHFSEKYKGENGSLDMDYWVLRSNLEKAKVHFKDAVRMMEAFEYWFGPYPFYEDGYKLVEVPYPGMEHQSSITYGNGYENGFLGKDFSATGWGKKFDFIIIHESGHEWFANSITYKDMADMWIHESFTCYSEALFLEYFYGKDAGAEYVRGARININNNRPIIADYNVNQRGDGDMYQKGSNMLHTLRQIVNDDNLWRSMLRGLNEEFYHQTVTTKQIEDYMSEKLDLDLTSFFDQYLRDYRIPVFEYRLIDGNLDYRWSNCIESFDMQLKISVNDHEMILMFNSELETNSIKLESKNSFIKIDPDYYIYHLNTMGE